MVGSGSGIKHPGSATLGGTHFFFFFPLVLRRYSGRGVPALRLCGPVPTGGAAGHRGGRAHPPPVTLYHEVRYGSVKLGNSAMDYQVGLSSLFVCQVKSVKMASWPDFEW
jgi:hypothetical protein